jgi:integrase/recombinase XerD
MARIKKPTVSIVILKSKQLVDGQFPIFLRLTFDRESKYYSLKGEQSGLSTELDKWNPDLGRFKRNKELNRYLDAYELRANEVLRSLESTDFSFEAFEGSYFKKYEKEDVLSYTQELIDRLIAENRLGTCSTYRDTKRRLMEFKKRVYFKDVTFSFLESFEKYLLFKGNSVNTIGIYMRTLRAIYNKAIAENLIRGDAYPFKKFKIKTGTTLKRALSKADIKQLLNYEAKPGSREWHSLNLFLFSYFTRGMNMMDMANLTWEDNIIGDRIVYTRAKTANTKNTTEPIIIKIEPEIKALLDRYSKKSTYVFPILEPGLSPLTQRYRTRGALKKIGTDISSIAKSLNMDVPSRITHYWARHTYATALKRSGIPIAVISEALGHSSESTTKAYLDKFEQTEIDNTFRHLI